jgi:uncharacterized RDD family membrane protein YckC
MDMQGRDMTTTVATPGFCERCGTGVAGLDGVRFCPGCGASLTPLHRPAPASYLRRMAGLTIDWLLLGALMVPVVWLVLSTGDPQADEAAGYIVGNILIYGAPFLYWALLPAVRGGRTVGRRIAGVRLVRAGDGRPVTYGRALGRAFLAVPMALFVIPIVVDLVLPLFGGHQSLCDRATDTIVTGEAPA